MSNLTLFEPFNPKGNSPDAVVYIPEERHLAYKGIHYKVLEKFPDDMDFTEARLLSCGRMSVKGRSAKYQRNYASICKKTIVPDEMQKAKLTALFQKHGSVMAGEAQKMLEWISNTKTLIKEHVKEINAICPGLDPQMIAGDVDSDCEFYTDALMEETVDEFKEGISNLYTSSAYLAEAEPFTRKRKAGGV
jgi:hypothetical protein